MTEKVLPFTDEVIVVLVHKCLQQLQLLALHLDMLGYILGLLIPSRKEQHSYRSLNNVVIYFLISG